MVPEAREVPAVLPVGRSTWRRRAPGGPPPGVDIFRMLQMSARGPDGYPLDVHGHKLPLPPQDAVWLRGADATDVIKQRAAIQAHAQMLNGTVPPGHAHTPELERALRFKPRAEEFIYGGTRT